MSRVFKLWWDKSGHMEVSHQVEQECRDSAVESGADDMTAAGSH